jgi:hypothetical protein
MLMLGRHELDEMEPPQTRADSYVGDRKEGREETTVQLKRVSLNSPSF